MDHPDLVQASALRYPIAAGRQLVHHPGHAWTEPRTPQSRSRSSAPLASLASALDPHPRGTGAVNGRRNGKRYPWKEKENSSGAGSPPHSPPRLQITPPSPPPPNPFLGWCSCCERARVGFRALGFRLSAPCSQRLELGPSG